MAMIRFLILDETQAATVRGETSSGAALDPRWMDNWAAMTPAGAPYTSWDGPANYYVLPYAVLLDPAHEMWHSYLMACPDRILDTTIIFLPPPEE